MGSVNSYDGVRAYRTASSQEHRRNLSRRTWSDEAISETCKTVNERIAPRWFRKSKIDSQNWTWALKLNTVRPFVIRVTSKWILRKKNLRYKKKPWKYLYLSLRSISIFRRTWRDQLVVDGVTCRDNGTCDRCAASWWRCIDCCYGN